jgi:hypothetical protein
MQLIENGHPCALRDFTAAQRKSLAKSGHAMPDGSFPIENEEDLHNAVRLAGHAHNPAAARAHIRARAAAMGMSSAIPSDWDADDKSKKKAASELFLIRPAFKFSQSSDGKIVWIQAFPKGKWDHPEYGEVLFDDAKLEGFKRSFDEGVMGQEVPWGYEHGLDRAKGNKAAGFVREVRLLEDGLYAGIEFTDVALSEIKAGEWKYNSPEYRDEWTNQATGETHTDVFWGGSLTNYPFLKGISPVNLSELATIVAEVADKEHSEPGTGIGGEPGPRRDYDPIAPAPPLYPPDPDPNVKPPGASKELVYLSEGGVKTVNEAELRKLLGIDETVKLSDHITQLVADAEITRRNSAEADEAKKFAELFPEQAKQLALLSESNRKAEAKAFSEQFKSVAAGEDGKRRVRFTPQAIEQVEGAALKFSEGTLTQAELGEMLMSIAKSGVVELSELGSEYNPETGPTVTDSLDAAKRMSEIARDFQAKEAAEGRTISLSQATMQVAKDHPDLYAAYREGAAGAGAKSALRGAGMAV